MRVISYYWHNDDLILELEDGSINRLIKPYYTKLKYSGLEYESNELVTLVGNVKYWPKPKESRKENE